MTPTVIYFAILNTECNFNGHQSRPASRIDRNIIPVLNSRVFLSSHVWSTKTAVWFDFSFQSFNRFRCFYTVLSFAYSLFYATWTWKWFYSTYLQPFSSFYWGVRKLHCFTERNFVCTIARVIVGPPTRRLSVPKAQLIKALAAPTHVHSCEARVQSPWQTISTQDSMPPG